MSVNIYNSNPNATSEEENFSCVADRGSKLSSDTIYSNTTSGLTSVNVQGAIDEVNDKVNNITHGTCANLLNPTAQTRTINGVTFTNNGDGTYTVNGTASAQAYSIIRDLDLVPFRDKDIKIVGCPSGGGADKYQFNINIYDAQGTNIGSIGGSTVDYGEGAMAHMPPNAHHGNIVIVVQSGYTANNLLFKPMLTTDLNAKYDDYVPYTGDSGRLNEDVSNKQDKTDNNLATTSKTIVGAINEHESDISQINSDLTYKINEYTVTVTSNSAGLLSIPFQSSSDMLLLNVIPINSNDAYISRINYDVPNQVTNAILTDYTGNILPNRTVTVMVEFAKNPATLT